MNITGLQYTLKNRTLEIYFSGCYGSCPGCHNAELKVFSLGTDWKEWKKRLLNDINSGLVVDIWLLGGDPMDQNLKDLEECILYLKEFDIPIWLWTRHDMSEIPKNIQSICNYIKTGKYIQEDESYVDQETGIELASRNQKIYKMHH